MHEIDPSAGITFRPARPEDKDRMLQITARTWDDGDYIPEVWERWLADPKGEFTVAEQDGGVVALAKLTWMDEGQWWMEGLRVDPERRLTGIGQAMNTYQVGLAKKLGARVIRYATGITNAGSHRIGEKAGFHLLARFAKRVAEPVEGETAVQPVTLVDADAVWNMARQSELFQAVQGLYVYMWRAAELTRDRLVRHLEQGQVWGVWGQAAGLGSERAQIRAWCLVDMDPDWERLGVYSLYGTPEGITTLARALRVKAGMAGKSLVDVMTLQEPTVMEILTAAGYHLDVDPEHPEEAPWHGMDLMELRLE